MSDDDGRDDTGACRRVANIMGPGSAAQRALDEAARHVADGRAARILNSRGAWIVASSEKPQ